MKSDLTLPKTRFDESLLRLRNDILEGHAKPGSLLAEAAVARQLGVSRVPVREALFALEREGLVEFSSTGRAYVKQLTPQDFEELFILRLTLEPAATRLAATHFEDVVDALEENIAATAKAKALNDVTKLDLEFHELILAASKHQRLLKLWRSLRSELELWLGKLHRNHEMQTRITRDMTVESHRSLVESFRTQSPAVCERMVRQHIQGWREWLPMPKDGSNLA